MKKKQKLGSETAKQGFKNEKEIVSKFNNWENDIEAKSWLQTMDYKLSEIEFVEAVVLSGYKTDVQVQVTIKLKKAIDVENLQVKLVSNLKGFNQIDKRWVDKYVEMWSIPNDVVKLLKKYTGELKPTIKNPKDNRRTFVNGEVIVTKQGNIKIGRITMQRKGGDGGRETAKMLQFKINPAELFEIKNN